MEIKQHRRGELAKALLKLLIPNERIEYSQILELSQLLKNVPETRAQAKQMASIFVKASGTEKRFLIPVSVKNEIAQTLMDFK